MKHFLLHIQANSFKLFLLSIGISGLLGGIFFGLIYGRMLNPLDVDWILGSGWDTFQHQIGWELYRAAPWHFPMIGQNSFYGYPVGVPIIYTDSLPLLAIPFKLLSPLLPLGFQYFGLWTLANFVLQGVFGFLLLFRITKKHLFSIVGSSIFIMSPIMLFRIGGHGSLAAHWLLLWALYVIVGRHKKIPYIHYAVLLFLSFVIHPYLFILVVTMCLAHMVHSILMEKIGTLKEGVLFWGGMVFLLAIVGYIIGMFYTGSTGSGGFGIYSMNINALVNPYGWRSSFLPDLPWGQGQFEGFMYLGAGVLFLLFISIISLRFTKKQCIQFMKKYWIYIGSAVVLTLISLSNIVVFGSTTLVTLPLPTRIEGVFSIIRASGRMFWPLYYAIILFAFWGVSLFKYKKAVALVVFAVCVQAYDFQEIHAFTRQQYQEMGPRWEQADPFWEEAATMYSHLAYVPDFVITLDFPSNDYGRIGLYAARNSMTLNTGYYARPIKGEGKHLGELSYQLASGNIDSNTLYIITRDADVYTGSIDTSIHFVGEVDGLLVIAPFFYKRSSGNFSRCWMN